MVFSTWIPASFLPPLCVLGAVTAPTLFGGVALHAMVRGSQASIWALRKVGHPKQTETLIRGARRTMLGIALASLSVWSAGGGVGWLYFALAFFAEEMLETGVMLLALRGRNS